MIGLGSTLEYAPDSSFLVIGDGQAALLRTAPICWSALLEDCAAAKAMPPLPALVAGAAAGATAKRTKVVGSWTGTPVRPFGHSGQLPTPT